MVPAPTTAALNTNISPPRSAQNAAVEGIGGALVLRRRVLGEDLVQVATRVLEHVAGLVDLRLVAAGDDLHDRPADAEHQAAEIEGALVRILEDGLPRLAELLAVLLDVGRAGVGEPEGLAAVGLLRLDEALVLEER